MFDSEFGLEFDSEWLSLTQGCDHCLTQHAQLQAQVTDLAPIDSSTRMSAWTDFQTTVQTKFLAQAMPMLDRDPQLRSWVPEVVRLMKLLQMDWQFWQAARQPEKQATRQQQFGHHLTQLGLLLSALQHLSGRLARVNQGQD